MPDFESPEFMAQLKRDFDRDGFVVIRNYLDAAELDEMRSHLAFYRHQVATPEDNTKGSMKSLDQRHEWFRDYLEGGNHVPVMKHLLGDGLAPDNVSWISKPKGVQRTLPHYDAIGSYLTPPSGISLWIALDDINLENGCLHYEKGSHRVDKPTVYPLPNYDEHGPNVVAAEVAAGDAVMHSTLTVHFSIDPVDYTLPRNAMVFAYWGGSSKVDPARAERSRSGYVENRVIL